MSTLSNSSDASATSNNSDSAPSAFDHDPFSALSSPWSSPDYGPIEELVEPPPVIPGLPEAAIAEIKAALSPPIGVGGLPVMRVNPAWSSVPANSIASLSKK